MKLKKYIFVILICSTFLNTHAQIEIPVTVQIVRTTGGQLPRITPAQIDVLMVKLNKGYNYMGVTFIKCGENFVDNSLIWSQFNSGTDSNKFLLNSYTVKNTANIFITDLVSGSNGRAVFPYKQHDWVIVDIDKIADSESTLIHEFGHYFGLRHTYSGVDDDPASSDSLTIQDGEDAEGWKYGDYLIDTPLDAGSRRDFDQNCTYIGNQLDANGDLFQPDGTNYMGRGHGYCRSSFSEGQEKRMIEHIKKYRYYLKCNSTTNNNLSPSNSIAVTTFPHTDDFDREYADTFWVQARDGDDLNWKNAPSTSSTRTGPNSAQSGQTFIHFEASTQYTETDEAILLSPAFDFKNQKNITIDFYYHMYGEDTGSLSLEINTDESSNWTPIFNKSGEQHSSGDSAWTKKTISLNAYAEKIIQLRFRAVGTNDSKGDISIDNITVNANSTLSLLEEEISDLKVFPNPVKESLNINTTDNFQKTIKIYSVIGKLVYQKVTNSMHTKINTSILASGIYYVKIKADNKKEAQIKVVKH